MGKKVFYFFSILLSVLGFFFIIKLMEGGAVPLLNPKGMIAIKQKELMVTGTLLMLIVVVPVFLLTFFVIWKYRDSKKSTYAPEWDNSLLAETVWWGFPCAIVIALSVITWKSSFELDPFKPIVNGVKPLRIQAVALQWRWLFIYPEQGIASMNFVQFPEKTPLNFEITSDAPMNSFWIPDLGGQIYAMPGMRSKLYLIADEIGTFRGCSANLSGSGFAKMNFLAKASSDHDFDEWVQQMKESSETLDVTSYKLLVTPSDETNVISYVLKRNDLYDQIIMKYMMPMPEMNP